MNTQPKPTPIPKKTLEPQYEKLQIQDKKRRQKNREASLAKNKALAQPFSFHEADIERARQKALNNDDIDDRMLFQFRARNIPWGILIPRFKMMMERDEHEREQRIRRNAEQSFQNSKLFPRMQAQVDEKKAREAEDLSTDRQTVKEDNLGFPFHPTRARSVPDFRRI